jgi:hypothetical protein
VDPLTIYAGAQATVAGIKGAIALGKDINSLMGDFSKFFHMADQVHVAGTQKKIESIKKSDAKIAAEALEIAWASKKLREDERYLKDMLIMSGNADVYFEMLEARTRMKKERDAMERQEEERKQKEREMYGGMIMNTLLLIAGASAIVPIILLGWQLLVVR